MTDSRCNLARLSEHLFESAELPAVVSCSLATE